MQEENQGSNEEVNAQPQNQEHVSQEKSSFSAEDTLQADSDQKEYNWKRLREEKEKAEKERQELQAQLEKIQAQTQQSAPQEEEEDYSLAPDDLVEWRHVEKRMKKLESQLKEYQQQSSTQSAEVKLKSQFPDFESVVTRENMEKLSETEPELAASIRNGSDLYSKGVSAYKLIKKLGISPEAAYEKDKERAQENLAKPRPTSSVGAQSGQTPLSQANAFAQGLTPELRKQLLKEMNDAMSRR